MEISDSKSKAESISRQLRAWADSLQNSGVKGQRYLTEAARRRGEQKKRAAEFSGEMERIVAKGWKGRTTQGA